ncbi:MAG: hypothetical protein MN733_08840, partial [Nitrososphaera sp.]|nr:hypothetical protein [Nitrososphaera sp.]
IKQVVSVANGTVTNVEMSSDEETAFMAEQAANLVASQARAAVDALLLEKNVLYAKLIDALITGDPIDPVDVARYRELR